MKKILFALFLFTHCQGTDLKPWLPDPLVPFLDTTFGYYTFNQVRIKSGTVPFKEGAYFATMGGRFSYEPYAAELEFDTLGTDLHSWGLEDVRFTARYLIANDISGENSVSTAIGISFLYTKERYLEDPASFHHAPWEWVFHVSVGKELPCGAIWSSRGWAVLSFGLGNEGSPWFYTKLAAETDWQERVRATLFVEGLLGLGDDPLDPFSFTGYGPLQHRSIATGAEVAYSLEHFCLGWIKGEYSFIPWAFNYPVYGHRVFVRWELPLGF